MTGEVSKIQKMLEYVVAHNKSYYITYTKKHKFDDQYAIADYAIKVAPDEVALDYHQQVSVCGWVGDWVNGWVGVWLNGWVSE